MYAILPDGSLTLDCRDLLVTQGFQFPPGEESTGRGVLFPVIAAASAAFAVWLGYAYRREIVSWILQSDNQEASTTLRQTFRDCPFPTKPAPKNHTHGFAAASRTCASQFAEYLCATMGLEPYFVQCSAADIRHNRAGSRSYFWTKDVLVPPSSFDPPSNAMCVLVDVDYYLNLPLWLNSIPKHALLYTIVPESVADSGEVSFTFDANNTMLTTVSGGASYEHPLWNFSNDHVSTVSWSIWGVKVRTWLIDSQRTSKHRAVVLLSQSAEWTGFRGFVAWACLKTGFLSSKFLDRLVVAQDDFLILDVVRKDGIYRSVGKPSRFNHAELSVERFDALLASARASRLPITPHQVQPYFTAEPKISESERVAIVTVVDYLRSTIQPDPMKTAVGLSSVQRYHFNWDGLDDRTPSLHAFMNPIIPGAAFAPDISLGNEVRAIKARVLDVKSEVTGDLSVHPFLMQFALEFAEMLFPVQHEGEPMDDDYVTAKQSRPSQRRILEEASWLPALPKIVNSFLKRETYQKLNDPRVISTIDGATKLEYSAFIYAITEHFSKFTDCGEPGIWGGRSVPWYAFGHKPREIATFITKLASRALNWIDSDLSKMDGRFSELLRHFERICLTRFFKVCHHAQVLKLHGQTYNVKGVTRHGHYYSSEFERRSGSPDTAAFNTAATAFISFIAFRRMGLNKTDSWTCLGIYGGDDGGTPDVDPDFLVKAAADVGQKMTMSVISRHQPGLSFLSRYYGPSVWEGDCNSMCDLTRQLVKFHVTTAMPSKISPLTKLVEKSMAFSLTDANTPVLGHFVQRVVELAQNTYVRQEMSADDLRALLPWGANVPREDQYPNDDCPWMWDYAVCALQPYQFDFRAWHENVNKCVLLEQMLEMPVVASVLPPEPPADDAVLDGEVVPAPPKPVASLPPKDKGEADCNNVCKFFQSKRGCKKGEKCNFLHVPRDVGNKNNKNKKRV